MTASAATYPDLTAAIEGTAVTFSSLEEKFEALDEAWANDHPGTSVMQYNSFLYQQIIGMGPAVVPLLLSRLRNGEGHWIYALSCITGREELVTGGCRDADAVIRGWLEWGVSHGRISQR